MSQDNTTDQCQEDDESNPGPITCWCGATGTFEELFDSDVYSDTCGGSGTLHCHCGGDFCVCHHHGEVECDGCRDCDLDEEGFYEDYDY